jgi:hypothetical protein
MARTSTDRRRNDAAGLRCVRHDLALGPSLECVLCRRELGPLAPARWKRTALIAGGLVAGALALVTLRPKRDSQAPGFAFADPRHGTASPVDPATTEGGDGRVRASSAETRARSTPGAPLSNEPTPRNTPGAEGRAPASRPPGATATEGSAGPDDNLADDGADPGDLPAGDVDDSSADQGAGPAVAMFGRARGGGAAPPQVVVVQPAANEGPRPSRGSRPGSGSMGAHERAARPRR